MNIKEQMDKANQTLYEDLAEVIRKFQSETGVSLNGLHYNRTGYSDGQFPKIHFADIKMSLDL